MDTFKMQVPDGVEDCLPAECYIKKRMEAALRRRFVLSGYDEVETPTYEYLDVFQSGVGAYMQESMIKFVGPSGRILVLRPDLTVPIARLVATKFPAGGIKRLFYIQNSYAAAEPAIGKAGEFTQAGIELIGDASCTADAEVIALAVRALQTAGLKSFTIDIGQVAYFKALVSGLELDEAQTDALRRAVDSKNVVEIEAMAEQLGITGRRKQQLLALPNLFGGAEVFDKALALSDEAGCREAVENLKNVYSLLTEYGLAEYVSIDFGMLHDIAYYSGIIFRGLTPEIGFPVVSGGRYDDLLAKFGSPAPATGFALGIKRVMIAMERQGLLSGYYTTDAVVSCSDGCQGAAFAWGEAQRAEGKRVVLMPGMSEQDLLQAKEQAGAKAAVYFGKDGMKTL
jgi:ATP phosphoribosyltransferase regulatory subunit